MFNVPPRLLVFDLDGTLIDSSLDLCNSVNAALTHVGKPSLPNPLIASYIGDGAAMLVRRALGDPNDLDALHPALTKPGHIKLEPGRHTIHVPYYEGTPYAVALSLWVRVPGDQDWKLFDLRDFTNSQQTSTPAQP